MARTSTFYSTAFVAILSAYMAACGGGGDSYPGEAAAEQQTQAEKLARFEFAPNECAFDSKEARDLAALQYPVEFARCGIAYFGNTDGDGQPWPPLSWPSTPDLSKEYPA